MEYTTLGWSGIQVPRLCLGGMSFGKVVKGFHQWVLNEDDTRAVVAEALNQGMNFIDTANCYAEGTSEQFIGGALKRLGVKREEVVLASKVFFNEGGLSAEAIHREIDKTLAHLGTDYLDLYIIHRFDYHTPMEETLEALDSLVCAGKVRALGASEMYAYQLYNLQQVAKDHGWTQFTSMQCHYNLLYREDERELIPVCRQFGMALTPYSPLASGHLTRTTWNSDSLRSRTDATMRNKYDGAKEDDLKIIARVANLAEKHQAPMADVALAWLRIKGVESPIVGCSSPARVDAAVHSLALELTPEEMDYLEEPYCAHELVGPAARPGEKPLAGTTIPPMK